MENAQATFRVLLALPFRPGGARSWGLGLRDALAPDVDVRVAGAPLEMARLLVPRADLIHTAIPFVRSRRPLVATVHGDFRREAKRYRRGYESLVRRADAVTVPSRFLQNRLDLPDAQVIPNGIADPGIRWTPRDGDGLRVLVASKFAFAQKTRGSVDALHALAALRTSLGLEVTVAGGGPLEASVRVAAQESAAHWLGWQTDLPALFGRHDVLVYRSYLDNQPMLLLQAMLAGIPIVANSVGDLPHMLPTSCLADGDDELRDRLEGLQDAKARQRVSRLQRERAEAYLWPRIQPRWMRLYRALLA